MPLFYKVGQELILNSYIYQKSYYIKRLKYNFRQNRHFIKSIVVKVCNIFFEKKYRLQFKYRRNEIGLGH